VPITAVRPHNVPVLINLPQHGQCLELATCQKLYSKRRNKSYQRELKIESAPFSKSSVGVLTCHWSRTGNGECDVIQCLRKCQILYPNKSLYLVDRDQGGTRVYPNVSGLSR